MITLTHRMIAREAKPPGALLVMMFIALDVS